MSTDQHIRDAAVRLFAEKGFAATGIRELANAVGITTASLYHYVGTKEDLLVRIMREGTGRLLDRGRAIVEAGGPPEEQLGRLVRLHVVVHALHQRSSTVVDNEIRALSPDRRDEIVAQRDAYEDVWRTVLERGVAEGVFRAGDPGLTRLNLIDLCTGPVRWYRADGPLSLEELGDRMVDRAFALVGAARDGRPLTHADAAPDPDLIPQVRTMAGEDGAEEAAA